MISSQEQMLEQQLTRCVEGLDAGLHEAVARFGSRVLGAIHLPSLGADAAITRGELQAVAALFWCRELEQAGLPGLVEALAAALVEGRWRLALSPLTQERLGTYHRERSERHTAAERRYRYSVLFGGPGCPLPNASFPGALEAAIVALARTDGDRLAMAWRSCLETLVGRAAGATRFDADHLLLHVQQALDLLNTPDLAEGLGGGGVRRILERHGPVLLHRQVTVQDHLDRGLAGLEVFRWVADHLPQISAGRVPGPIPEAVRLAATRLEYAR